ncbi:MAG: YigZ family protein [Lentisphaeria bacterium]|nr:YigZ family protein [Lentisphaeria bacterium]
MLILKAESQAETRVKNSRFLAEAIPVNSPEEAKELWRYRKEHYDNGGHIVYAFTVGNNQNISGYSDDGEPSGTAGRPVLSVLLGSGLTNTLITVARWFGGTKLGTGGLVHAYSDAAKAALENAEFIELVPMEKVSFEISYPLYSQCRAYLDSVGFNMVSEEFSGNINIRGTVKAGIAADIQNFLNELGNGRIICRVEKEK